MAVAVTLGLTIGMSDSDILPQLVSYYLDLAVRIRRTVSLNSTKVSVCVFSFVTLYVTQYCFYMLLLFFL